MTADLPMEVPGKRTMYAVITADGRIVGSGKSAGTLYKTKGAAQSRARHDGDSVIPVTLDFRAEPLFIRSKKL